MLFILNGANEMKVLDVLLVLHIRVVIVVGGANVVLVNCYFAWWVRGVAAVRVADAVVAKPAMPILGGDGDSAVMVFCYQGGSGQVVSSSVVAQQLGCLFYLFFFFGPGW